ncbi:NAD(P)H-hydrate dehydratase [Candidatus Woesearchaeota archaeon]|mgnify:CR=1 FL=1|jgi:ADP-dependent NAD(P)H-hydrate dehydratase / NAD(P)H-hydrate epimerase|nr:NAD(P)H-hydrate dehydratase [Candidatus Woesearchaeota archaeon]MBT5397083.1 NAD(P)H-hydrate dehydratase [Candidatus Woesearchaeota archaeon]MBT6367371.1 NAD(P)H-hydrate dehydratase [Candidatus Woesearchaeota archaeon]MBT7762483.1 NAD(P)H-hydrate dehydratase [Candidatus Woesearchaeota archaeon]
MNLNQVKKLMERKKTSRKGENGRSLIIGGSEEYVGAVALAGLAALRAGCDVVTVATPEKVAWAVNKYAPDLITQKVKFAFTVKLAKEMVKNADKFDATLIGNGITRKADKFCSYFIKKSPQLKVVDADALKSMSFKDFQNSIITPHETELEMLLVNSHKDFLLPKLRQSNAKEKAEILQGNLRYFLQNNNVLLLKGPTDIILSRNKIAYNRTGNQGMTKAGTGDVLAGLAVGFLAKTRDLFKSAVAASYINGFVGDQLLKKKKGYAFIASDIIDDLSKISTMGAFKTVPKKIVKKNIAKVSIKKKSVPSKSKKK